MDKVREDIRQLLEMAEKEEYVNKEMKDKALKIYEFMCNNENKDIARIKKDSSEDVIMRYDNLIYENSKAVFLEIEEFLLRVWFPKKPIEIDKDKNIIRFPEWLARNKTNRYLKYYHFSKEENEFLEREEYISYIGLFSEYDIEFDWILGGYTGNNKITNKERGIDFNLKNSEEEDIAWKLFGDDKYLYQHH